MAENSRLDDSILVTVRESLGLEGDVEEFDNDLIVHINSALNFLTQVGVGPVNGFAISGESEKWSDFITEERFNMVKSYIVLKTRILFDPSTSSFVISAWKEEIAETEWRLKEEAEEGIFH